MGSMATWRKSLRAGAALLAALVAAPAAAQVEYYHLDAIGSVRVVTDEQGNVIERHDYLPFGEECTTGLCAANPKAGTGQTHKFTAKERDTETGLDYFGARYQRASTGRFTTVDPVMAIEANLVDPQRWNRYAYAKNNPLRNIDPDGRDTIDLAIGLGQGIGTAALGMITGPYAIVSNPSAVISAIAQDVQLLAHGISNPGDVASAYTALATSSNDSDQRSLGAAIGQGAFTAAAMLAPTAKGPSQAFLPDSYYAGKVGDKAPGQSAPFGRYERFDGQGNLKQVTTYDGFGDRVRQYDVGARARHGEGVHTFEYSASRPRQAPGGGDRSGQVPLNEFGKK